MEPLIIKETSNTPEVTLNKNSNKFEITGTSVPENVMFFYNQVIDWFRNYFEDPNEKTNIVFSFNYLNTSSTKIISDLIRIAENFRNQGIDILITWCYEYEDTEMKELGEEMAENFKIPFDIIRGDL